MNKTLNLPILVFLYIFFISLLFNIPNVFAADPDPLCSSPGLSFTDGTSYISLYYGNYYADNVIYCDDDNNYQNINVEVRKGDEKIFTYTLTPMSDVDSGVKKYYMIDTQGHNDGNNSTIYPYGIASDPNYAFSGQGLYYFIYSGSSTSITRTVNMSPRTIDLDFIDADKVYDGTTNAIFSYVRKPYSDYCYGYCSDNADLAVSYNAYFNDANFGGSKAVTIDNIIVSPNKYIFSGHYNDDIPITATISKRNVSYKINNKEIYWGDYIGMEIPITYSIKPGSFSILSSDILSVGYTTNPSINGYGTYTRSDNGSSYIKSNLTGLKNNNYNLVVDPGVLTILRRPLTVIADSQTKYYGDKDPDFTFSIGYGVDSLGFIGYGWGYSYYGYGYGLSYNDKNTAYQFSSKCDRGTGENVGTYEITVYPNGSSITKNYDITYIPGILTILSPLGSDKVAPSISYSGSNVTATDTVNGYGKEIVIPPTVTDINLTLGYGASNNNINITQFISSSDSKIGVLPKMVLTTPNITVDIPKDTTITGTNSLDSILRLPELTDSSTITKATVENFIDKSAISVVNIGSLSNNLSFSYGIRILIAGQAGKKVGYIKIDNTFYEIKSTCSSDSQASGDALLSNGECKIDVGSDLVIWTKHFTKFLTYEDVLQTVNTAKFTSTGFCSNFKYSDWKECSDGFQTREILSWNGGDTCDKSMAIIKQACVYTDNQQINNEQQTDNNYGIKDGDILPFADETKNIKIIKLVDSKYKNGTLLRASDGKIYVIVNGEKQHIKNLEEFKKEYSNKMINNVSDDILNQY